MAQSNEDKRNNLLHSAGKLQVGRRDGSSGGQNTENASSDAKPEYIRQRNKATWRGLALGAIVVVVALVVLMLVGNSIKIAG